MQKSTYTGGLLAAILIGSLGVAVSVSQSGRLVVGTDLSLPPFEYLSGEDGTESIGFDIDIAQQIAKNTRRRVKIVDRPFSSLVSELEDGAIDMIIAALPITPERAARVDFSRPYYSATQVIVTRAGNTPPQRIEELSGRRIAVQTERIGQLVAADLTIPHTLLSFASNREMINALHGNQIDAIIIDNELARYYHTDSTEGLLITDIQLEPILYGIAVQKGDERLLRAINATLSDLRNSGEYNRLLERHVVN